MLTKIYEVPSDKVKVIKKIIEAQDKKDPATGKWIKNEWALAGYKFVDGRGLGLEGTSYYIYVKQHEEFFKNNEKPLVAAGAKLLKAKDAEKVQKAFEESEQAAEAGMGAIFG